MILEKTIKVKDLPEALRGGISDVDSLVVISVRSVTDNGFAEDFEQSILEAEKQVADAPSMPIGALIAELKSETKQ